MTPTVRLPSGRAGSFNLEEQPCSIAKPKHEQRRLLTARDLAEPVRPSRPDQLPRHARQSWRNAGRTPPESISWVQPGAGVVRGCRAAARVGADLRPAPRAPWRNRRPAPRATERSRTPEPAPGGLADPSHTLCQDFTYALFSILKGTSAPPFHRPVIWQGRSSPIRRRPYCGSWPTWVCPAQPTGPAAQTRPRPPISTLSRDLGRQAPSPQVSINDG